MEPLWIAEPPVKNTFVSAKKGASPPTTQVVAGLSRAAPMDNEGAGAACVTVTVWPAIVSVPVRAVLPALAETEKLTALFPALLAPEATVIQAAFGVAVQEHPLPQVTVTVAPPASLAREKLRDESA